MASVFQFETGRPAVIRPGARRRAVPVVGDTDMVRAAQIPDEFSGLIEALLARGGVAWPDVPGLLDRR